MSTGPVFIVGAPRSGTTLLRQMLSRHPRIAICGETHFLTVVYQKGRQRAFGDLRQPENRRRLIQSYLGMRRAQHQFMASRAQLEERALCEGDSWPSMFAAILKAPAEAQGKPRWGEKTPQHARFTETLLEWFPDAAILHALRDPRDVVASLLRRPFASASVVVNARAWLRLNQAARRSSGRPGYRMVRYEDLVAQPEAELREICRFLGEEYSPGMLMPEQEQVESGSGMDRFRTPLTSARSGVWRQELSRAEVAQIEWVLGEQMEAFGYSREAPGASLVTRLRGASFAASDTARMAFWRLPALWYYFAAPTDLANYERWRHPAAVTTRLETGANKESLGV